MSYDVSCDYHVTLPYVQSLQGECSVLREALTEFSHWVRGKLGNMEENMEIFRIIYSLHGSLSQVSDDINSNLIDL